MDNELLRIILMASKMREKELEKSGRETEPNDDCDSKPKLFIDKNTGEYVIKQKMNGVYGEVIRMSIPDNPASEHHGVQAGFMVACALRASEIIKMSTLNTKFTNSLVSIIGGEIADKYNEIRMNNIDTMNDLINVAEAIEK